MTIEQKVLNHLSSCSTITIVTHPLPDGDAIGSSSGLYLFLKEMGMSDVQIILPTECPKYLGFINQEDTLVFETNKDECKTRLMKSDTLFILDFNNLKRIGELGDFIKGFDGTRILIDHHQQPDLSIVDFDLHNTKASSTCELVYQFCVNMQKLTVVKLTTKIGEALYTGILTDTGGFKHGNTGHITHQIASDIMKMGVNTHQINTRIFNSTSVNRYKLLGHLLNKTIILNDVAIIPFTLDERKQFDYVEGDTEGIVNMPLSCDDVKVSFFISERDGFTKLSARSKELDVNKLCREFFNGGGHINAAAGTFDNSIEETIKEIKRIFGK